MNWAGVIYKPVCKWCLKITSHAPKKESTNKTISQSWSVGDFAFPLYPLPWLPTSAARTEHGKSKRCRARARAERREDTFHHECVGNQGEILMFSHQFLHKHQISPKQQTCIIWNAVLPPALNHCLIGNADKEAWTSRLLKYYSINTIAAMILRTDHKPKPPEKGMGRVQVCTDGQSDQQKFIHDAPFLISHPLSDPFSLPRKQGTQGENRRSCGS